MADCKFGVALFCAESTGEGVAFARMAENLGYDRLWVGDSHMIWREVYVLLGAIAVSTTRVHLGPGVTHPELRHPTVTASAMVSLSELSGGRVHLGIGIGATGPGNIGLKPVSLARLEETVKLIRRLVTGETVELHGKKIQCVYAQNRHIPIYVAATSPRTQQVAPRWADGLICGGNVAAFGPVVRSARRSAEEAGRSPDDVQVVCWTPCSISSNRERARSAVRGMVARVAMVHLGVEHRKGMLTDEKDREAVERLWKEYNMYHHMGPEHDHLVREEWIDRYAIAGTPEEVRAKVNATVRAGADEIGIVPFGESKEEVMQSFAREVIGKV